ncbi:hypothetical protein THIARS_60270 [Thiomonas delicata]|uniref:Uncharacterized protein n=1 Tax=Thiomonas delicata TaxID=364030 RepID=A0A238D2P7_THIDL|nr:hypothetical protein THIARS_60270 [Thiomonas delicata]
MGEGYGLRAPCHIIQASLIRGPLGYAQARNRVAPMWLLAYKSRTGQGAGTNAQALVTLRLQPMRCRLWSA